MSDSFISIVPIGVKRGQVAELSMRVINWLTERQIIVPAQTPCIHGQDMGYPPGQLYKSILDSQDFGLLQLKTNGLQVVTTRQVFDNGLNGLEEINCPACGGNNIDADWGQAIGAWHMEQNDKLKCHHCQEESSITEYNFIPNWGFGEFGLIFWNWPTLTSKFIDDLNKLIGREVRVVFGRV